MRNCTHYKYIIYTRQMDFKLNTGSCCMGKKGCSKIQNNKLNTYDWLCDVPDAANATDYVEVQFKNTRKGYYLNSSKIPLEKGDLVAVEASPGHDIGTVTLTGKLVLLQMKKNNVRTGEGNEPKKVYRKAKPTDIEKYEEAKAKEHATMIRSRQIAADLGLNMKIGDVEYQGDGNKAIFYYIADERVDFRQLIKVLAEAFRVRIEMKQIGARQEAGRIGGIGPCGRELCCSSWMTSFVSVATGAARYQDISMNPQKLAGQCAKLKCCINYEVDAYVEAQKRLPSREVVLETKDNTYYHFKTDIFKREITYSTDKSFAANLITIFSQPRLRCDQHEQERHEACHARSRYQAATAQTRCAGYPGARQCYPFRCFPEKEEKETQRKRQQGKPAERSRCQHRQRREQQTFQRRKSERQHRQRK